MAASVATALISSSAISVADPTDYPAMPTVNVTGPFPVSRVVDGDTIWVDNNGDREKVRLIGINTPELHDPRKPIECLTRSVRPGRAVLTGKAVYLESDPSQDSMDRFGRTYLH